MKKRILTIIFLFIIYVYTVCISVIPENIILFENENIEFKTLPGIEFIETVSTSSEELDYTHIDIKAFGVIDTKETTITKIKDVKVVPVGKIIGLKLYTNGVLVVGMSEIEDENKTLNKPYELSDVKEGDTILEVDNQEIENIESLKNIVNNSEGKDLELKILRDGTIITSNILPVKTGVKEYKLGLWVKDAATGVGTISFFEPKTNSFAVLGHGITDADTGNLINIDYGELVTSKIISIKKGENGTPGEVRGTIINQQTIGKVNKNTNFGVYGSLENLTSLNIDASNAIEVATREEIKIGEAKVLCATDTDNVAEEFSIEIEKIYLENSSNNKSMLIRITDDRLLGKTGGIIRGLSGAPIIQNGKFVGAITNVLVSNPEVGYAIFGDLMIKEIRK